MREQFGTYKTRWTLFSCRFFRLCIFRFTGSDPYEHPHDHPNWFFSLGIKGGYTEERYDSSGALAKLVEFRAPWVRTFKSSHIHRILKGNAWAICLIGQERTEWGYWVRGKRVSPSEYERRLEDTQTIPTIPQSNELVMVL